MIGKIWRWFSGESPDLVLGIWRYKETYMIGQPEGVDTEEGRELQLVVHRAIAKHLADKRGCDCDKPKVYGGSA